MRPSIAIFGAALAAVGLGLVAVFHDEPGNSVDLTGNHAPTPGWRIMHLAPASPYSSLEEVAATGPNDAWAVGNYGDGTDSHFKLQHWNGSAWTPVSVPGIAEIENVSASSPKNVWINGSDSVYRWDGAKWSKIPTSSGVAKILAAGSTEAWLVGPSGPGYTEHYDGTKWIRTPLPDMIYDAAAIDAHDIWAVGTQTLLHWNGSQWSSAPFPKIPVPRDGGFLFEQVVAVSHNDVWVRGTFIKGHEGVYPGVLLLHWDGRAWSRVNAGRKDDALGGAASSDGQGGLWFMTYGNPIPGPLIHYTGGKWLRGFPPIRRGFDAAINCFAPIPGTRSIWAVGNLSGNGSTRAAIFKYEP